MSRTIMLIPIESNVNLTSLRLGILYATERKKIRLNVFKPIFQSKSEYTNQDHITTIINKNISSLDNEFLEISNVKSLLSRNKKDIIMEKIIANYFSNMKNVQDVQLILVEGLTPICKYQFIQSLNYEIATTLNAEIIFVMSFHTETVKWIQEHIQLIINSFGGISNTNIAGIIIDNLNIPNDDCSDIHLSIFEKLDNFTKGNKVNVDIINLQNYIPLPILGIIPWNFDLIATRVIDIANYLKATIINVGDINIRRVQSIIFCTHSKIQHMLQYLRVGSLLVISVDRYDLLITACLAAINGIKISAILLIGDNKIDDRIGRLCESSLTTGLPIFIVDTNIWKTYLNLQNFRFEIPVDDHERIKKIQRYVANSINSDWIESLAYHYKNNNNKLSPSLFRYKITELARKANKRIVLPEGYEPRILKAAVICSKRGIATCVLLGNKSKIYHIANSLNIELNNDIEIIDPDVIRENYIARLIELRKNKGMSEAFAKEQLQDNVVLGTMMLECNEVDGLVSGAVHTTANTIRPSLQLIKTAPGTSLVSSIFFMLLPEQVYVYGDCAININPTTEQLAEIAIQSADSAITFGIEPRVAMISYSTGASGTGNDVKKVYEATLMVQQKRPDLIIDGPLQYDAAVIADVAKSKAPNSPVAGRANVFIFPDLNTGNTTYKAVQRSTNIISIGPILQGMRKPVNDLSRGALVNDIVYTIALTAIQAV